MNNYIIIAQSILEGGRLGHYKKVAEIGASTEHKALLAYQFEDLAGKGSFLCDDEDVLECGGIRFTAISDDDWRMMEEDDDELAGITDLEEALDLALDPINERLAQVKDKGRITGIAFVEDPPYGIEWVASKKEVGE